MARYAGPVCRLCRRSTEKLMLKGGKCITKCTLDRRHKPPGPHMTQYRRLSERGLQLKEKQKARYTYDMLEKQFRKFFHAAAKMPGVTGDNLIVRLERRLDNVVYRLGFAESRAQARQLVQHGHIMVNGRKTNIPSFLVKEGDTISWREGSTKTEYYIQLVEAIKSRTIANWLSLNRENLTGQVVSLPTPDDVIDVSFKAQSIVEYYSR
jgi:small subunit ribosomal protein S4